MSLSSQRPPLRWRAIACGITGLAVALLAQGASAQNANQGRLADAPDLFFSAGDQRLRYRDIGRGDPVVLIHGRSRTLENNWPWMADSLAKTYRVIAFDQRGHGKSTKPESRGEYGIALARDVVALLDHLGLQRAHLVGFSLGAVVAANVTVHFGSRVRTVSLLAGPFYPDSITAAREGELFVADMQSGLEHRGLLRARGLSDSVVEARNSRLMAATTRPAWIAVTRSLADLTITRDRASTMTVPAVIVVGTADEVLEHNRRMAAWWPGARLVVLPGVNHGGLERNPEVLAAIRKHVGAR
jgi:pimeloyl-ACP methyl ester carboxylesterase